MTTMRKNKLHTQGYFIKRLRDSGYYVNRIFDGYDRADSRRWTVMINPGAESVVVTCYQDKGWSSGTLFEFNDGGRKFFKNYQLSTDSIEVVVSHLVERGIYGVEKINNK